MADGIKLTLTPFGDENAAAEAVEQGTAAVEEADAAVAQKVQQDALNMQKFSEEEQKMIEDFSKQINLRDSNLVFSYGAAAQQNISQFSDVALKNVQTKDLDEVGDMIADLVVELKGFDADEESRENRGFLGFFKRQANNLQNLKARFDHTEVNVNRIVEGLEQHRYSFSRILPCWTNCTIRISLILRNFRCTSWLAKSAWKRCAQPN